MKKTISFILAVFAVAVLAAAARPSLDGRAVVADDGEMPNGLFAKTIGYLPGDSVTVTNPANGSSVDVLVLGSIDASEGVAILLSPQSADRLGIQKDANVQVKITKRTGSLDENVSGTAVLEQDDSVIEYTESESPEDENVLAEETEAENTDDEYASADEDSPVVPADEVASDTEEETDSYIEENDDSSAIAEAVEETVPVLEPEPELENVPAEDLADSESESASDEELVASESVPSLDNESADAAEETVAEIPETSETVEDEVLPPAIMETPEEPAASVIDEGIASADEADDNNEELFAENAPELVADNAGESDIGLIENEESNVVSADAADDDASAEYAPIVLVPSEPYPPENLEDNSPEDKSVEVADVASAEQNVASVAVQDSGESEQNASIISQSDSAETNAELSALTDERKIDEYVKNENELEKGKYYLQIASLSKKENIVRVLDKYADKYPVVLVRLESGVYRILIGPLSADEYGMIKERFVSYGYKDAFLRKIK